MRLITAGVAGSVPGPGSAASTYLLQAPAAVVAQGLDGGAVPGDVEVRDWTVVIDLGNGGMGAVLRHTDPHRLDAVWLSHLHPDHCADLYVYLRHHPVRGAATTDRWPRLPVHGQARTLERAGALYGLAPGESMDGIYREHPWSDKTAVRVGPFVVTPYRVAHPVEAYGLRITGPSTLTPGTTATLAYTGDTDTCPALVDLARDADLLLAEASYLEGRDDHLPRGNHLTGTRAGQIATDAGARRLLITHIPVWNDPQATLTEARSTSAAPVTLAVTDQSYEI